MASGALLSVPVRPSVLHFNVIASLFLCPQEAPEECKQNGGAGDTEVKEENGKPEENGKEAEKKDEEKKEEKKEKVKKKRSFRSFSFLRREKKHKEVKEAKDKNGDVSTVLLGVPACCAGLGWLVSARGTPMGHRRCMGKWPSGCHPVTVTVSRPPGRMSGRYSLPVVVFQPVCPAVAPLGGLY